MATAYAVGTLDDYLERICEQIQLTEPQFGLAVKRYRAVGDWLTRAETALDRLSPEVFPQGSMLQRTTVRPVRKDREVVPFDLDCCCRCDVNPVLTSSQSLYGKIESRLRSNIDYGKRLSTEGKCLRLNYDDDDFWLDIIPACKDPSDPEGVRVLIPDRDRWGTGVEPLRTWRATDPLRFAAWFGSRCVLGNALEERKALASVAPVPPQEPAVVKAILRRIVQLLKRERDMDFLGEDNRPSSILLTTLAGRHHRGQNSLTDALQTVLDGISGQVASAKPGRIVVPNPTGESEDLARLMTETCYRKFCEMIERMRQMIAAARRAAGVPNLYPVLTASFGDRVVKRAFNAVEEEVRQANQTGKLGATGVGGAISVLSEPRASGGVQPARGSTFHMDL